jgi:hypothetical protein
VQLTALEAAAAARYQQQLSRWGWQLHSTAALPLGITTSSHAPTATLSPPAAASFDQQGATLGSSTGSGGGGTGSMGGTTSMVLGGGCYRLVRVPQVAGVLLTGVDLQVRGGGCFFLIQQ